MADEETPNRNSNIKMTDRTQSPITPEGPLEGLQAVQSAREPGQPMYPRTLQPAEPDQRQINAMAEVGINKPMTISAEAVSKAINLLTEERENWGEPPSERTYALGQILELLTEGVKIVETTGKMQVVAITTTSRTTRLSRLETIRIDTEKASARLVEEAAKAALEDTKSS